MKKIQLYIAMAAVLTGLSACSDSDEISGGNTSNAEGSTSYVAVNIVNPQSQSAGAKANAFTRVSGYENGTTNEDKITNVRFYFFNNDGSPYLLTNSNPANVNWLSYNIDSQSQRNNDPNTVESVTNAVLVINGATGTTPSYMIAVANPDVIQKADSTSTMPDNLLGTGALHRNALTAITMQTRTYNGADGFLMTNSVYGEGGTYRNSTPTAGHIMSSEQAALADPVQIYVERLAAKVSINRGTSTNWTSVTVDGKAHSAYPVGKIANPAGGDSLQVYAVVQGVGLADEQHFGKIFKDMDGYAVGEGTATTGDATSDILGINPWNSAQYHRSYWEVSPEFNALADNPLDYPFARYTSDFTNGDGTTGVFYTMPNTPTSVATPEETNRSATETYRTKVLLATQLMYQNGTNWQTAEVCKYRGHEYLGQEAVKTVIANQLQGYLCKLDGGTFKEIEPSDIEFITPESNNYKTYEVIPELVDRNAEFATMSAADANAAVAAGNTVTTYHPNVSKDPVSGDPIDDVFYRYANKAEVRNNGDAYYYTTIRHLANDPAKLGYFGVVRNHWYQVTINSLRGFGTPVFNPNRPIIPITPSDDNSYMAAQINVLQWRVVSQSYDIDGTEK